MLLFLANYSIAQVGIGTTIPNTSAELEILSTNSGLLIPRMTQAQKNTIATPATGLLVYETDVTPGFWYYDGTVWTQLGGGSSSGWLITGNVGTSPATNFIGTTDTQDFVIRTNNVESFRITSDQNVGVGITTPTAILEIVGANPVFRYDTGTITSGHVLTSDANGNATWTDPGLISISSDNDWLVGSTSTSPLVNADRIRHLGQVVIGKSVAATPSTAEIDIDNGLATGTTIGIGGGTFTDGLNVTYFDKNLAPNTNVGGYHLGYNNTISGGIHRWNNTYGVAAIINTSDGRLKKDVENLSYGIKEIMQLKPISYNWKREIGGNYDKSAPKEIKLGFRAQELEAVIPEVVMSEGNFRIDEEGNFERKALRYKGVSYESIIPILVKAQQEQQIEIDNLIQKNKDLKEKLNKKKK